jgi:type IV secretion system protein TrbL
MAVVTAPLDFPNPLSGCNTASLGNLTKCLTGVTKGAATDAFSAIAGAFGKAADNTINWLWTQMSSATAIRLGGTAFHQLLGVALAVAVVVAVGIFVAQLAVSAVRRDAGGLSRSVGGLFVMALGAGAAVAITQLLLDAVDAVSAGVLQVTTGDTVQQMGTSILAPGSISGATSNPAGLILISLLALVAVVVVWFALTIRKLLIIIAAVLSPFAFAGSLADFSRSWVRRWVELVVALVFSKLILIFIFVIGLEVSLKGVGSTETGGTQAITQTVTGILILALAGLAPWLAIKMAHFAGVHLEGMHLMAGHATAGATTVQSMARPVSAAVIPGGTAGAAASLAKSSAKPWSPQTPATTQAGTESSSEVGQSAPSNASAEAAPPGATTPSTNGSQPSSNEPTHDPTVASASANGTTPPAAGPDAFNTTPGSGPVSAREFFWQTNQTAARNTTPGPEVSPSTPPFQTGPPTPQTIPPKGNPAP